MKLPSLALPISLFFWNVAFVEDSAREGRETEREEGF